MVPDKTRQFCLVSTQLAVDVLCQWATTCRLSISLNKCCVLNVGKSVCDVSISRPINDGVVPVMSPHVI